MEVLSADLKLLAFYEIAQRANLTDDPDLVHLPVFQAAKELYEHISKYLWEAFGSREATDDFRKFHIEGILSTLRIRVGKIFGLSLRLTRSSLFRCRPEACNQIAGE